MQHLLTYAKMIVMKRIGPKMQLAIDIVHSNGGGIRNRYVCDQVNPCPIPSKNEALGYNVVNRCIAAGLLVYVWDAKDRTGYLYTPAQHQARVEAKRIREAAVQAYPIPFHVQQGAPEMALYGQVAALGMYRSTP